MIRQFFAYYRPHRGLFLLDFSCAVFNQHGDLIANAPHMPVHLGSMGESIKTVIRENHGKMKAGNVYVLNAPYNGGTHLPDVTLVMAVDLPTSAPPGYPSPVAATRFHLAVRAHHADVGGRAPGSMPVGLRAAPGTLPRAVDDTIAVGPRWRGPARSPAPSDGRR